MIYNEQYTKMRERTGLEGRALEFKAESRCLDGLESNPKTWAAAQRGEPIDKINWFTLWFVLVHLFEVSRCKIDVLLGPGEEVEGVDPAPKGTTPRHRSSRMRIHRGTWATRSNLLNKLSLPFPGNSLEIPSWARSPSPILGATNKSKTTAPKSPATDSKFGTSSKQEGRSRRRDHKIYVSLYVATRGRASTHCTGYIAGNGGVCDITQTTGPMGIQGPATGVPVLGPPGNFFGADIASAVGVGSTSAEDLFNSAASSSFIKVEDQEQQKRCNLETREALSLSLLPLSLLFG
jgi:hypothetical protein